MESTRKALQSLNLNDRDQEPRRRTRCLSTISVEGYNTSLKKLALKLALKKHFASCGDILFVSVIRDLKKGILKSVAFLRLEGEGAQEKALQLDGSDVGGWKAIVKAAPWPKEYSDRSDGTITQRNPHCTMYVKGHDTARAEIDIQIELCNLFSSCGEVTDVGVLDSIGAATITIVGVGCEESAMAMNDCDVAGMDLVVKNFIRPENKYLKKLAGRDVNGYMLPSLKLELEKEKEMEMEMEMEKRKGKEKEQKKKKKKKKMEMEMEKQIALF